MTVAKDREMALLRLNFPTRNRSYVLLAPAMAIVPANFLQTAEDPERHARLLNEMQRLRGRVYLQDGAIGPSDVTPDGRHRSPFDKNSWHLLSLSVSGQVVGCVRLLPHCTTASYKQLFASHSA